MFCRTVIFFIIVKIYISATKRREHVKLKGRFGINNSAPYSAYYSNKYNKEFITLTHIDI